MKIVIAGGTGQIGGILAREYVTRGYEVVIVARGTEGLAKTDARTGGRLRFARWDGKTVQPEWAREIDGADVVVNLAGRSVNCRYTKENLGAMMSSRVDSTRIIGEAIAGAANPPRLWLQMSTATIYAHSFDRANDEATGIIGGGEPGAPAYWRTSIDIAKAWEKTLAEAATPRTRKVALRSSMVMSPDKGGIFDVLSGLVRAGLGGPVGGGRQYVSWIHEADFVKALDFLMIREDLEGPVNICSPGPVPQGEFMRDLRSAWGARIGLPAAKWMAEIGAFAMRTDTELLLKSRRVVPGRLLAAGFKFNYAAWAPAARDLASKSVGIHAAPEENSAPGFGSSVGR